MTDIWKNYEWSIPEEDLTKIAAQYSPFRSMDKKSQAEEIFAIAKIFINHPAQYLGIIESIQKSRSV